MREHNSQESTKRCLLMTSFGAKAFVSLDITGPGLGNQRVERLLT